MAAELGLLSLSQLQQLAQQQQQPMSDPWGWAGRRETAEEADSWEVRAFARDTASATGTTWPPRSYTCSFCRREFRSAQALGGHMNVHRRDRARLRQSAQGGDPASSPAAAASAPPIAFQSADFAPSSRLCLFYPILGSCPVLTPPAVEAPSTLLSMAPFPGDRAALDLLPGKAGSMRGTGLVTTKGTTGW